MCIILLKYRHRQSGALGQQEKVMRTNIVIDDDLLNQASQLTGLTKRAVVEEALRLLIQLREQEQVKILRGKLAWEGDLNEMREGRLDG